MATEIELHRELLFPCPIYYYDLPTFLPVVRKISREYLKKAQEKHNPKGEKHLLAMSDHFAHDERLKEFCSELAEVCHYILASSGYQMDNLSTFFTAMWTQEHHYLSLMENHIHGHGEQLVGFYCLDAPTNCSRVVFHDPRPGKVQINLPEQDHSAATLASQMINFELKPGRMFIAPAWLPHSFTRNMNPKKPTRFVHFDVGIQYTPQHACECVPAAEVI